MASCLSISRYFLHLASRGDEPCPITHMQLQKLMYYAQGWSLALHGRPLFSGHIEAWKHGPVVPSLFGHYTSHRSRPLPWSKADRGAALTQAERDHVEAVWADYGRFSAARLREMTHAEAPWREARAGLPDDASSKARISEDSLRAFFTSINESRLRRAGIDPASLRAARSDAATGNTSAFQDVLTEARSRDSGKPGVQPSRATRRP